MKIGLINGHGGTPLGASGCGYLEDDLTIEVVKMLDFKLRSKGIDTLVYPYDRNAFDDVANGGFAVNFKECDYVLEVHFNACVNDENGDGKTTGTEIYVTPREQGTSVERLIVSKIADLGFRNRGVKARDFYVINKIKNLGVSSALLECCFIDDKDDMDLFIEKEDEFINAISDGIIEGFGIDVVDTPVEDNDTEEETESDNTSDEIVDNAPEISTIELVKRGQRHSITFTGYNIGVDGIVGNETRKQAVKVLQKALNLDYNANLNIDGIVGKNTLNALGNHYVRYGERQYMVTALEILLSLKGYDTNGVEYPGILGKDTYNSIKSFQSANGLKVDGIAGVNTFKKLVGC